MVPALVVAASLFSFAALYSSAHDNDGGWMRFSHPDRDAAMARRQWINWLLRVVRNPDAIESRRQDVVGSIAELGDLHATEATHDLAEMLEFHMNSDGILEHDEMPTPDQEYPAVKSLIQIGEPSVSAVAAAVASRERSERFRWNCTYIILRVIRDNDAAKSRILNHAKSIKDPAKAARLISLSDPIPPSYHRPDANRP